MCLQDSVGRLSYRQPPPTTQQSQGRAPTNPTPVVHLQTLWGAIPQRAAGSVEPAQSINCPYYAEGTCNRVMHMHACLKKHTFQISAISV